MEAICEPVQKALSRALSAADSDPVITVPTSALGHVTDVLTSTDQEVRALVEQGGLDETHSSWGIRGRLLDAIKDGSDVREGAVDQLMVVGDDVLAAVDGTPSEPVTLLGTNANHSVHDRYDAVWNEGDDVTIRGPSMSTVATAVDDLGGRRAVQSLRTVAKPTARGSSSPTRTAVFAAAAGSPKRQTLLSRLADALDISERSVERQLTKLRNADVIELPTADGSDGPGRAPKLVVQSIEPPLPRSVQSMF